MEFSYSGEMLKLPTVASDDFMVTETARVHKRVRTATTQDTRNNLVSPRFIVRVGMTHAQDANGLEFSAVAGGALPRPTHPTREEILAAYRAKHRETKETRKKREKQVFIENVRKRPPHLLLKQVAHHNNIESKQHQTNSHQHDHDKKRAEGGRQHRFLSRLIPQQFKRPQIEDRPEGWAASKITRAMRRYYAIQQIVATDQHSKYLNMQCKKLFDECCKCTPLAHGPSMSDSGVYQLAGPNLPRILRILRSKKNVGIDLQQRHGLAQYTVTHVAAQRGYTALVRELLAHWVQHPVPSPVQPYSIVLLRRLLTLILQLRSMKTLVCESNSELRDIISTIGVRFSHFSDALDKLHDSEVTLEDLLVICGHPLVLSKDAAGNTPLHYAAEGGYLSLCELFIQNGAKINEPNKAGETPLHFAISSMHEDVCIYLVKHKADVSLCRYVSLQLLNNVTLRGTFVDAPDNSAVCKVMPILQSRSIAAVGNFLVGNTSKLTEWVSPWRARRRRRVADVDASGKRQADATVRPEGSVHTTNNTTNTTTTADTSREKPWGPSSPDHVSLPITGNLIEDGMFTRVESLASSPLFQDRNSRDIIFFRTAPGNVLMKPDILCVFLVGDHVALSEVFKSREQQQKGKVFHLLIQNLPQTAVIAMDTFRAPLFRCSMQAGFREHNQRWIVGTKLKKGKERRTALLAQMKGQKRRKKRRRLAPVMQFSWEVVKKVWKTMRKLKRFLSVQNVFAMTDTDSSHKDNIICEPKGIVYEYVYDNAEFRGGQSPTLSLIVETECKELIYHPWFGQLMDHKWNSFARQSFRRDFHVYFIYFVAFFIATYLHIGDPLVGMPVGGYRSKSFTYHASYVEYIRDFARLVYSLINAYYTVQEFRSYLERGSLRAYFQDGWNWFDLVQIVCVWMLLATELKDMFVESAIAVEDYELHVYMETYYSWTIWRVYDLRTTLMSIVGPQIFIKWIQFARGNRTLGPFVRMIFKMFKDISLFLVVFCLFLLGFAFAFFILQLEGCKTYCTAIAMVLQVSLGAWDWNSIYEGGPIAVILFVLYAIIGTIMLLNLLIAMLGNTYDKIWEDRLLFFELERAKATLSIQNAIDNDDYDEHFWCQRLYVLEGDKPIEGIQFQKF